MSEPLRNQPAWRELEPEFTELCRDYPKLAKTNHHSHLDTPLMLSAIPEPAGLTLLALSSLLVSRRRRHRKSDED